MTTKDFAGIAVLLDVMRQDSNLSIYMDDIVLQYLETDHPIDKYKKMFEKLINDGVFTEIEGLARLRFWIDNYILNYRAEGEYYGSREEITKQAEKVKKEVGIIYFAQASDTKSIKIGITTDLKARLCNLSSSTPARLDVIGIMRGTYIEEQALHERFRAHRLKGEWFLPAQEILDFIKNHCGSIESD